MLNWRNFIKYIKSNKFYSIIVTLWVIDTHSFEQHFPIVSACQWKHRYNFIFIEILWLFSVYLYTCLPLYGFLHAICIQFFETTAWFPVQFIIMTLFSMFSYAINFYKLLCENLHFNENKSRNVKNNVMIQIGISYSGRQKSVLF